MEYIMKLSILICHLEERKELLDLLVANLKKQIVDKDQVEIIIEADSGQLTIGHKRNMLLSTANGEYIAFIDDDDNVADTYVADILKALKSGPDCVGIEGCLVVPNVQKDNAFLFKHSIKFAGWYTSGNVFYRTPNHLNPILKEIAVLAGFNPTMSFGEDSEYSKRIRRYLNEEVYIDHPIYYYNKAV